MRSGDGHGNRSTWSSAAGQSVGEGEEMDKKDARLKWSVSLVFHSNRINRHQYYLKNISIESLSLKEIAELILYSLNKRV